MIARLGTTLARGTEWMRSRPRLVRVIRATALTALLGLCLAAIVRSSGDIGDSFREIGAMRMLASMLTCAVGLGLTAMAWRETLAALGPRLTLRDANRIYFAGQLGKYLPGAVWNAVLLVSMAREKGAGRQATAASFLTTIIIALTTGATLGAATLVIGGSGTGAVNLPVVLVVIVGGTLLLHPRVLNRLLALAARIRKQPDAALAIDAKGMLRAVVWQCLAWVVLGLHVALLTAALTNVTGQLIVVSISAFALSWCLGFLVVFVPAGLGVRDVAMVAVLSTLDTSGSLAAVAIASRAITVVLDGVLGAAALGSVGLDRVRRVAAESQELDG